MTPRRWILHLPTTLTSLDEARELTERLRETLAFVTVLDFGKVIASGSPDQVRTDPAVLDAYLGEQV